MLKRTLLLVPLMFVLFAWNLSAQNNGKVEARFQKLIAVKEFNVVFDYSKFKNGIEKLADSVYKKKKVHDLNEKYPDEGRETEWLKKYDKKEK